MDQLAKFDRDQKLVVPSPFEPSRSGIKIQRVILLRDHTVKLSTFADHDREQDRFF